MRQHFGLRITITIIALAGLGTRLIWPNLKVDAVTLGLLVVAVLPWMSALLESAKFPGGWEIKFRDLHQAGEKVVGTTKTLETKLKVGVWPFEYSRTASSQLDPNLALVALRIEMEKRLRQLAQKYDLPEERSLVRLFNKLQERGVLNDVAFSGIQELITAGNRAAHGASVEPGAIDWAYDYGPRILAALDQELQEE